MGRETERTGRDRQTDGRAEVRWLNALLDTQRRTPRCVVITTET